LEEEDRWRVAVGERGRCGEVKIRWTRAWWMLRVFFSFYFYFFMFFLIKKKNRTGRARARVQAGRAPASPMYSTIIGLQLFDLVSFVCFDCFRI
jgi:hypothetical protein